MFTHIFCDVGDVIVKEDMSIQKSQVQNLLSCEYDTIEKKLYDGYFTAFCRGHLSADDYYHILTDYLKPFWSSDITLNYENLDHLLHDCLYDVDNELLAYVAELRLKYTVIITTDTNEWQSARFRTLIDLDTIADQVIESHLIHKLKADDDYFEQLCADLGIAGTSALLIDDKEINNTQARKVAITAPVYTNLSDFIAKLKSENIDL